jgi:hypothetical protein
MRPPDELGDVERPEEFEQIAARVERDREAR